MFLQYYLNKEGEPVYKMKKFNPLGQKTCSAHPERFSPDDKYSRHRITIKKGFKVLMTQQPHQSFGKTLLKIIKKWLEQYMDRNYQEFKQDLKEPLAFGIQMDPV
ncbi:PREDICTED: H/ACA ribonucleoprotein complex subunit 3-like [Elephantulus edwardii]|uniref:H/ACA ribonucleoprotein complex subunit 3-like n=1 Tax=Elephantulus edwardii TaxID=28737 RepID=UPI0003F0A995|nr:PREDICTED: H/ACA ribonucleoprotein complex subunit 3-like [Elephantulus edwardii]